MLKGKAKQSQFTHTHINRARRAIRINKANHDFEMAYSLKPETPTNVVSLTREQIKMH